MNISRRNLLVGAASVAATSAISRDSSAASIVEQAPRASQAFANPQEPRPQQVARAFNGPYAGEHLDQIAFPLGGIGAGMICLEGNGTLSKFCIHNRPELQSRPLVFAALGIKTLASAARVLEGPLPKWKLRPWFPDSDTDAALPSWGLPRFRDAVFEVRFPFATVRLEDENLPYGVEITGWSPFCPGDASNSSLPVAGLEYKIINHGNSPIDAVFSFNSMNFLASPEPGQTNSRPRDRILPTKGGFLLYGFGAKGEPWEEGHLAVWVDDPNAKVNHAWFRGGEYDSTQMLWNELTAGTCSVRPPSLDNPSPGATIFVPFSLENGQEKTIRLSIAWYVPRSNEFSPTQKLEKGKIVSIKSHKNTHRPWYAGRFSDIQEVQSYWGHNYASLKIASQTFSNAFYDSTLPPEVVEAVAANLTILKSPTVLRQTDGRIWAWEGVADEVAANGGGPGNSSHVWNYAQAMPHLFPDLERTMRETEFGPNQGRDGFQSHRAALPIHAIGDTEEGRMWPPAADGQPGSIIRVYRDWRISGDTAWMKRIWPKVKASMDYCIATWDPDHEGWTKERHLNTYDVFFWGADSMCTGLYLGALKAVVAMGTYLAENVSAYAKLLKEGLARLGGELFNGEYFRQRIEWKDLREPFPGPNDNPFEDEYSSDLLKLAQTEGPPYQYGEGCLSDGAIGAWACFAAGLGDLIDRKKVESHLRSVYRHNWRTSLLDRADPTRPYLACGDEPGLVICSWPKNNRPPLPVIYADEVWTGIEYQVASHMIAFGMINEGLEIVRGCRSRYDGRVRNPFDEIEAGHWYARAMSSYALLQAISGARFDAVDETLHLVPSIPGDFRSFLSTSTGFGTVGVRDGEAFVEVASGTIPYKRIAYTPAPCSSGSCS